MNSAIRVLCNQPGPNLGKLLGHLEYDHGVNRFNLNRDQPCLRYKRFFDFNRLKDSRYWPGENGEAVYSDPVGCVMNDAVKILGEPADGIVRLRCELVEVDMRDLLNIRAQIVDSVDFEVTFGLYTNARFVRTYPF